MSDSVNAEIARGVNPLQMASQALQLQTGRYNLQQAQLAPAYQSMRQLQMTNPNASWSDVLGALAQSKRIGANVDGLVANANEIMSNGGSPTDFIHAQSIGGLSPYEQATLTGPQQHQFQTAQGTIYGTIGGPWSKQAGQFTPGGFVQQGLSPEQWAQPTDVFDPKTQTYTRQPFGQAYGYPMPPGLGGGGGQGGGGGGGGGAGGGGDDLSSLPKAQFLQAVAKRESGGDPTILNYVARADPTAYARGATASGKYQFINSTWKQGLQWAGIDPSKYPTAMSAPEGVQDQVASAVYDHVGTSPWQKGSQDWVKGPGGGYQLASVPPGTGGGSVPLGGGQMQAQPGTFIGATSAQPVSAPSAAQPASGMQYFSPTGQPISPGGQGGPALPPHTLALPSPGFEKTAGASTDMFNQARASYTQQAQRISPLEQSLATLRAHPDLQTGFGAQDFQNLQNLAAVVGVQLTPGMISDGTAYAEIAKNLNRYYRSLPGANRSDMAELDAKLANPSPENQRDALDDLLARTIGTERMNDAGYMHFLQLHGDGNASNYAHLYADQVGQYTASLDPIGFAFDKMTAPQRRAYFDSLSPTEKTRYMGSIKEASRLYNLPIPQGG